MKYSILILLLATLFISVNAGDRPFSEPDECRYVEVSREMLQSRDFFVPTYNFTPYPQKPPLFFWALTAVFSLADGFTIRAALIPVEVAALLSLLLLLRIASLMEFPDAGPPGIAAMASTFLFFAMARIVRMDMILLFFVTAGIWSLLEYRKEGRPRHLTLFGLAVCGGLYTKGPVILIWLLLVPLAADLIAKRREYLPLLLKKRVWFIAFLPFLLWLVPALILGGPAYRANLLFAQNVSRVVSSFAHKEPLWYYFATFPAALFPLTFLVPLGMVQMRSQWRRFALLYAWIALPFILFSLFSGKVVIYLLPAVPAAALFAAAGLKHRWAHWILSLTGLFWILIGLALYLKGTLLPVHLSPAIWILPIVAGVIVPVISFSTRISHGRSKQNETEEASVTSVFSGVQPKVVKLRVAFYLLTLSSAAWIAFPVTGAGRSLLPKVTTYRIAHTLASLYPNEDRYASYREVRPSFILATEKPFALVDGYEDLDRFIRNNPGKPILLPVKKFRTLPQYLMNRLVWIAEDDSSLNRWSVMAALPESHRGDASPEP